MRRRRNPDVFSGVLMLAALGGVGLVAYEASKITLGDPSTPIGKALADATNNVATQVQAAAQSVQVSVGQSVNAVAGYNVTASGFDQTQLCQYIANWQQNGSQAFNPGSLIWGDYSQWSSFRKWATTPVLGIGYDPGPTPPVCWYIGQGYQPGQAYGGPGYSGT